MVLVSGARKLTRLGLTARCTYSKKAKRGIRIHVTSSHDGINYDTTDLHTFDNDFKPGQTAQKTLELEQKIRFIKVIVETWTDRNQSRMLKSPQPSVAERSRII